MESKGVTGEPVILEFILGDMGEGGSLLRSALSLLEKGLSGLDSYVL